MAAPIGAVVTSFDTDNTLRHYAVLGDGLQPVSPVVAAILRNTNSFGLDQPPRLGADDVARLPVADDIDTAAYPSEPVTLVDAAAAPLTCAQWTHPADATSSALTLLLRRDAAGARRTCAPSHLVGAGAGTTANRVVLTPGSGYLVGRAAGRTFWVSDTGVRYGIDADADQKTVAALGLTMPAAAHPVVAAEPVRRGPDAVARRRAAGPRRARRRSQPAVLRETP